MLKDDQARIETHFDALTKVLESSSTEMIQELSVVGPITGEILADGYGMLEGGNQQVAFVFMNARDYADLRMFNRDIIDLETRMEYSKMGVVCYCWGAWVVIKNEVPVGTAHLVPEVGDDGGLPTVGVMLITR